jgi:hypothetical protein
VVTFAGGFRLLRRRPAQEVGTQNDKRIPTPVCDVSGIRRRINISETVPSGNGPQSAVYDVALPADLLFQ